MKQLHEETDVLEPFMLRRPATGVDSQRQAGVDAQRQALTPNDGIVASGIGFFRGVSMSPGHLHSEIHRA
jgi:hypothetical protein